MGTRGYGTYRGRSPWKRALRVILVLLLILIARAAVALLYLQQYMVISSDGVRLEIPLFQQQEAEDTPLEPDQAPLVSLTPEVEPTVEPEPTSESTPTPVQPVSLPLEALYDGTAVSQVEAAGGDCALFDMKADSGTLGYTSQLELASAAKVSNTDPAMNAAIRGLNETQGLYTVARVSCFKDDKLPYSDRSLAILTNSGYRWTGTDGLRWASPTSADVQSYVTGVCVELAQLGFDEILLDNAGYPDDGHLNYIKKGAAYDEAQFSAVIDGFYAQVRDALADYPVQLSVVTTPAAQAGLDTLTGQTPDDLARFDRLWTYGEGGTLLPQ
jgi:hypothetical protein